MIARIAPWWLVAALGAQEPAEAFVEVVPAAAAAFVQQPVGVVVRIGVDREFFARHAVPLFQQQLDQPFHVVVPWLFAAEDRAVEPIPPPRGAAVQRVAVGDDVVTCRVAADQPRQGRTFAVFELHYRWLPLAAGTSSIAPVQVRYACATRFREDFLRGRQPLDREERTVSSAALQLVVSELPKVGRPPQWNGAVGEFTVAASVAAATVAVGESFALDVEVGGDGNLDRMPPMPWPLLPGFHVQGLVERRSVGVRTFSFDVIALRQGATEVPAVPFAAFSPARGEYVVHQTPPLSIAVTAPTSPLPDRVRDLVDADARAANGGWWRRRWWLPAAVTVAIVTALVGRLHRRRRVSHEAAMAAVEAAADPESALRAFESLCAACVGDPTFGPGTLAAIADDGLRARASGLHAALDAARFGGIQVPRDELAAVARALWAHQPR